MSKQNVVIVGAGPVGLISALHLTRAGIPVTLLEANPGLAEDLRASTFHPPTLDMLAEYGVTPLLIEMGLKAPTFQLRDRQTGPVAIFDLGMLAGDTDHPFRLQCEQFKLTAVLLDKLRAAGCDDIRFGAQVTGSSQDADQVTVTYEQGDETRSVTGRYVIACDGARSAIRKSVDIEFEGFTFPDRFLVVSTPFEYGDHFDQLSYVNYLTDPVEWCTLLRVPLLWRVLFPTHEAELDDVILSDSDIERRLQNLLPQPKPYEIVHRTLYRVHQRVAATYRSGRVFLAGDSAHLNNPLGGMGMNGGIHDGINLSIKLAAALRGEAVDLDLYERQRRPIAIETINAQTLRNKQTLEETDLAVRKARQDEMRRIAADPAQAHAYMLKSSMIESLRKAATIR